MCHIFISHWYSWYFRQWSSTMYIMSIIEKIIKDGSYIFFPQNDRFFQSFSGFFLLRACWKIAGSKSLQKLNVDVEKRFRVWGSQKTSFRGKYGEYRQKTIPYPPPLGLLILCYQNEFAIMEILKIEILKQSFKLHKKK